MHNTVIDVWSLFEY